MTLKQLLQTNSWLSISSILLASYPDEEKNMEGYETVFEKLLMMTPKETDMWIVIKTVIDEDESYVDVSGLHKHPKTEEDRFSQAIEFSPWPEWLGMEIHTESLQEFSEL